jgi:hypothetical protein
MAERHESRVLLARLAVREGMVSQETADRVLKLAAARNSEIPLGELLLQFGHISPEQYKTLMALAHRERGEAHEEADEQQLFGEAVTARGLATPDQVADALRQQAELAARGVFKNLGEILVERGILKVEQVRGILGEQDQVILHCPACREKYNVLRSWVGDAKCPADSVLLAESPTESVGVAATLGGGAGPESPIGLEFGGCRIVEPLGKGSMGAVYKAKHVGLNRYVAVKLLPTVSNDPELVKRLLFEARAIARLEHPNIVQVYDVGFQRGYFFMVMQLLMGQTLEARLQELRSLPPDTAIEIARDIARGLEAAHAKGIVHRDVKPANVMLTEDGKARLTDFGLAQDTENAAEQTGLIVGTPFYMSPEQWLGHKADERSDLYSLGVILFVMLTGRHPFEGATVSELMHQHLKVPAPSPQKVEPSLSEGLSAFVLKCMAKPPKRRYPNAKDLLADLFRVAAGDDPEALAEFGAKIRCGFCETMNPSTERKCKVCNEPLHAGGGPLEIATRVDEIKCDACGAITRKGTRACSGCAKPFCARCRVRIAVLKGHCATCLTSLGPGIPKRS